MLKLRRVSGKCKGAVFPPPHRVDSLKRSEANANLCTKLPWLVLNVVTARR